MTVELQINNQKVSCDDQSTIMEAARLLGISIPTICFHKRLTPPGLCRQCVVEVEGARVLLPACITKVREGMVVQTESDKVRRARRVILEMLSSSVDLSESPELSEQIEEYKAASKRFGSPETFHEPVHVDNPFYIRDYDKCILCTRCVQVCSEEAQLSYALTVSGRGFNSKISTFYEKPLPETSCVFCGNCIEVCPTGALKAKKEYDL